MRKLVQIGQKREKIKDGEASIAGIDKRHKPFVSSVSATTGITLVSLVVTIVVIIILATASIGAIFDEKGTIRQALQTKDSSTNASIDDEDELNQIIGKHSNAIAEVPDLPTPTEGYIDNSLLASPKIADGMIPVKWNGTNWVKTTITDTNWYNYGEKQWANVVLSNATFDETTGVLDENSTYSMLVWIPRYAYQITSGWHQDSSQLEESGGAGTISVVFIDTDNKDKEGNLYNSTYAATIINAETTHAMSDYVVHPAFDFGTTKLEGFWVGKYESSHTDCSNTDVTTGQAEYIGNEVLQIKPNVTSWRNIQVSDIYDVCRNLNGDNNPYGLDTSDDVVDPHMLKNTEWGAIAYLSKSTYGKETEEVYINNSSSYITGTAGATASEANTGTSYAYPNSGAASTTGNIYGVFDMSGGAWEQVVAYVNNSYIKDTESEQYGYGKSLIEELDTKYKDVYKEGISDTQEEHYGANIGKYGDAVYEVSSYGENDSKGWYADWSNFPNQTSPFFCRGGYYGNTTEAGAFSFDYNNGNASLYYAFRVTVPVLD